MLHPLGDLENRLGERLARDQVALGMFLLSGDSMIAEAAASAGIDWLVVDMEASPVTKTGAMHVLQALNGSGTTPVIRVPTLDRSLIEHALDIGAHAVVVPKVESAADAFQAAQACRYPPDGIRGINPVRASAYFSNLPAYLAGANRRTMCLVQIESAQAVECVGEIASTPGVDGLFIGMGDLAASLGQPGVVVGPAIDDARRRVLAAAAEHGKIPGIFAYDLDLAEIYIAEGFRLVAIGNEIKMLVESLRAATERLGCRR